MAISRCDVRIQKINHFPFIKIIGHLVEGVSIVDHDWNFHYANAAWCQMTQYTESELLSMNMKDLVSSASIQDFFYNIAKNENNKIVEFNCKDKIEVAKIHLLPIEIDGQPFILMNIRETGCQCHDAENDGMNNRDQPILDNLPIGYQSLDGKGYFLNVNQAWLNLLGYQKKEVIGRWFGEFIIEQDVFEQNFSCFKKQVGPQVSEYNVHCKNGSIKRISFNCKVAFDKHNQFLQTHSMLTDVSKQHDIENQLRKLTTVVEQCPVAILIVDKDGMIEYVNPYFTKLTGYQYDEVVGKNSRMLCSGQTLKSLYQQLWATLKLGEIWRGEFKNKKKNGDIYWQQATIWPIFSNAKAIQGFLCLTEDICQRKVLENDLTEQKKHAEMLANVKSQFLATMSHEIRTPMNAVLGMGELLLLTDLDERQRKYVDIINGSGGFLLSIINNILDYSKIDAGGLRLENALFSVKVIAQEVIESFSYELSKKKLCSSFAFSEDVPDLCLGDPIRFKQILANLFSNALKFTNQGHIDIEILAENIDSHTVRIKSVVKDTGEGIPESAHAVLFDPFVQADSSITRKHGGTGLGLSICQKLTKIMGGEIGFKSEVGQGSEFFFQIPLEKVTGTDKNQLKSVCCPLMASEIKKHQDRILVVEDDVVNQTVIESMLESLGYQVEIVDNGSAAIIMANQETYDLIFMDLNMPVMNGFETTFNIRQNEKIMENKHTTIIALTATVSATINNECCSHGMDDYLSKPLSRERLKNKLARWLPDGLEQ